MGKSDLESETTTTQLSTGTLLQIIDGLPLAISVVDKERRVILANRMTAKFANKQNELLIGRAGGKAFDCIRSTDVPEGCGFGPDCMRCSLRESIRETIEEKKARESVETRMTFKHLGERHLRISTLPLRLNQEDVALVSIEDITIAKQQEQALMDKERLDAAVETVGAVCHEMSQPVTAILGFSELLDEELFNNNSQKANVNEIKTQANRLSRQLKKLMSITRYKTKKYLRSKILDIEASSDNQV